VAVLALVAFAVSRLALVTVIGLPKWTADMVLYSSLAAETKGALASGRTVHEAHAAAAGKRDASRADVEYPPLAVAFIAAPGYLVWSDATPDGRLPETAGAYRTAMRGLLFACDLACFALLMLGQRRLARHSSARARLLALLGYLLATTLLWNIIYDRLDLAVGLLLLAAALCLSTGPRWLAGLVLATGTSFKLVPVLLVPLWLLSQPAFADRPWDGRACVRDAGRALGWLAVFLVIINAPFLWYEGSAALRFVSYHRARGLQVESLVASLVAVARPLGLDLTVQNSHGAWHMVSTASRVLAGAAGGLQMVVLLLFYGLYFRRARSVAPSPPTCALSAAALITAAVATATVLSPQYLFWILPLAFVLPTERHIGAAQLAILMASLLTAVLWPYLYTAELLGAVVDQSRNLRAGPTALGTVILLTRNALLVTAAVFLVRADAPARNDHRLPG
jgi:hypothetical protein